MREHHDSPYRRRRRAPRDPLTRAARRDLAATLERDYQRELRIERRNAEFARFWDRSYA